MYEYAYNYDTRVDFIKKNKPPEEQPLRLRLFQLIPVDRLPGRDSPEYAAYDKAWDAYAKAMNAYDKAWDAYLQRYDAEMVALHAELCPNCPWDGKTIFTRKNENGEWY